MAYTRSNTNAAHVHPVITIYVEEISGNRVTYKLWHQKAAGMLNSVEN